VIFRDTLAQLTADHPDRLTVVHTLTREDNPKVFGPFVRKGRMDTALLQEMIPDPAGCFVYLCGPGISKWDREAAKEQGTEPQPRFIEAALDSLRAIGVPDARIKRESYG
jgi:ferredoxin-NADP reductase